MNEKQKQLILDYQEVFGTDAGKRVRSDLETRFYFKDSFEAVIQSGVPEYAALQLGKREAYLYIIDKIEADPNQEIQEVAETEAQIDS